MKEWQHVRSRNSADKWLWLALLLKLCAGWYLFFTARARQEAIFFSLLCGSLSLVTIWAIRGLFHSENEKAIDRAVQKRDHVDGDWRAAVGTIHPMKPKGMLTAPFSGEAAVAYKYWVTRFERRTEAFSPRHESRANVCLSCCPAMPQQLKQPFRHNELFSRSFWLPWWRFSC